ncbi:unnamed protein product [Rotaria socialis]|uniref:Uncharacterized protein n=2 Tax=Rotaria socialis TaxID=392032 RepID=A0A820YIM6_9BILA|nr:unnamed protein product [Rotaria socialis]
MENLLIGIYKNIFAVLTNLKYLDLNVNDTYAFGKSVLKGLPSNICCSSSIVHLRIKMNNFEDFLSLMDGRLSQLHTFIIDLDYIYDTCYAALRFHRWRFNMRYVSSSVLNIVKTLRTLKRFSLYVYHSTAEFDSHIAPVLRRMSNLEQLTLSLRIRERTSFIDGTHLHNYILNSMPHLHSFFFDIVTERVRLDQQLRPSPGDILSAFIERGYNADCYINYDHHGLGRCHVYSLPFNMEHIRPITGSFPGGRFMNIRVLHIFDTIQSFEHEFFAQISLSFPVLNHLTLSNKISKNVTPLQQVLKPENATSVIEYSHLVELYCFDVHIDYVEQFLSNLNTRLPCLSKLHVKYEHLVTVTENFTRNATRINCAKLKHIDFVYNVKIMRSKNFYLYFPLLYHHKSHYS